MTEKITRVSVGGLQQQPNPFSEVPAGSLLLANNVIARRKGCLQPMPANAAISPATSWGGSQTTPCRMFSTDPAKDVWLSVVRDPTQANASLLLARNEANSINTSSTTVTLGSATRNLKFVPNYTQSAYVRNRTITTDYNSPVVNDFNEDGTVSGARMAGLPQPSVVIASLSAASGTDVGILSNTMWTAYRAVFYRRLGNYGRLVSAPSAPVAIHNMEGATAKVQLSVSWDPVSDPIRQYDYVAVYRVAQASTIDALGDYFQLAWTYQISSADVTNGFTTSFVDKTPDAQLGELLYTNAQQDTSIAANLMPPPSTDVCVYNDTTFYRNRGSWPTCNVSIPAAFGRLSPISASFRDSGIGVRAFTGSYSIGSHDITAVSATDRVGLVVGQIVDSGGTFDTNATITAITGAGPYTVTVSGTASSTAGSKSFDAYDTMQISPVKDGISLSSSSLIKMGPNLAAFLNNLRTASNVSGFKVQTSALFESQTGQAGDVYRLNGSPIVILGLQFTLYSAVPGLYDSFVVNVTNVANYASNSTVLSANTLRSTQDTNKNRVYFSKTGEPEHVSSLNYFDVDGGELLKLVATQSSMFAFCTNGIWRITGTQAPFTVQQLDRTANLVHPDCVGAMDNKVFAWVTDGLAVVTDEGCTTISTEAIGPALKAQLETYRALTSGAAFWGPSISCDNYRKEVWLNFDYQAASSVHTFYKSYVLNTETGVFTSQDGNQIRTLAFIGAMNATVDSVGTAFYKPSTTDWLSGTVIFNPVGAEADLGNLKEWLDTNLFLDDIAFTSGSSGTVTILFDGDISSGVNVYTITATSGRKLHCWVPRRCSLKEKLTYGFTAQASMNWTLYGFSTRYRVASETLKK